MHPLEFALLQVLVTAAHALPQAGTATYSPTMWAGDTSSAGTSAVPVEVRQTRPMKTLSLCCCCLARPPNEPAPTPIHYMGECSNIGTRDVCGSNYTGASGYAMGGLEGHPERIAALCSISRCGAMRFVD